MTPQEVVKFAQDNDCKMVDYKFLDFVGIWQHFSTPIGEFSEDIFEEGIGFDGSSIRGWQPIHNSDMLIMPDPSTAKIDPFVKLSTLSLICNIIDPITKEGYTRDPRFIAQKAEAYLKSTGIADTAYFGPEPEFLSSSTMYATLPPPMSLSTRSTRSKGTWNTGREEFPNLAYKPSHKEGYFPLRADRFYG